MTTVSAPASHPLSRPEPPTLPLWRAIVFRTGVVLTCVMATMNTINGGSALLGIQEGADAAPSSPAIGVLLFGIGLPTLLLAGTAWRPVRWALLVLILLRFLEAASMWIPFGPGDWYQAPENRGFYLTLVAVSLLVSGLMAVGLPRRRQPAPEPDPS